MSCRVVKEVREIRRRLIVLATEERRRAYSPPRRQVVEDWESATRVCPLRTVCFLSPGLIAGIHREVDAESSFKDGLEDLVKVCAAPLVCMKTKCLLGASRTFGSVPIMFEESKTAAAFVAVLAKFSTHKRCAGFAEMETPASDTTDTPRLEYPHTRPHAC